ncbi:hypothetical protein AB0N28_12485, partial [Streptomyces sp. NPDC051130]
SGLPAHFLTPAGHQTVSDWPALRGGVSRARRLRPRRLPGPGRAWTDSRELPRPPREPFRDWWARERGGRA